MKKIKKIQIIEKDFVLCFERNDKLDFLLSPFVFDLNNIVLNVDAHMKNQKNLLNYVVFEKENIIYVNTVFDASVVNNGKIENFSYRGYMFEFKENLMNYKKDNNSFYFSCFFDLGIKDYEEILKKNSIDISLLQNKINGYFRSFVSNHKKISFCVFDSLFILEIKYDVINENELNNMPFFAKTIWKWIIDFYRFNELFNVNLIKIPIWYIEFLSNQNESIKFITINRN